MRISTSNTYDLSVEQLQQRAADLSNTQEQMSSMKRVNRASDDPTAAAQAQRAIAALQKTAASQRAVDASKNSMTLTESALGDANDLLQSVRQTVVEAGNSAYSDADRKSLAASIRAARDQLFSIANRDDGSGSYLFGGQGSSAPPFVDAPGGVAYVGANGQTQTAMDGLPLAIDGQATWLTAPTGNGTFETKATTSTGTAWIDAGRVVQPSAITGATYDINFTVTGGVTTYSVLKGGVATALTNVAYTSGQAIQIDGQSVAVSGAPANGDSFQLAPSSQSLNVFSTLDKIATALETPNQSSAQITQTDTFALRDIDSSLARLQSKRSDAGEALNRIDGITSQLKTESLTATTQRSNAEDLDMTKAVTDFQTQQTAYDAALKAYAMVQRLSLFQYLNP